MPDKTLSKLDDDLADILQDGGVSDQVRFDHSRRVWHVWNGIQWETDAKASVYKLLYDRSKELINATESEDKQAQIKALYSYAKKESVLKTLAYRDPIAMTGDEWDTQPNLLGCANGVLDLTTGKFMTDPDPALMISRSTGIVWDPNAPAPERFLKFIGEIMAEDPEMISYLLLTLGYAMIGTQKEQKFWMWQGEGNNGKGTLAKVLAYVLGDYSDSPSAELYMKTKHGAVNASAPRAELVKLQGIRFAWMSEPQGGAFNDELVKAHTGDDPIQARPLYSNAFVTFRPTHTLVFLVNQMPRIEDVGVSMRRRARVIKFERDFSKVMDMGLEDAMKAEAPSILRLLAGFARHWYENGIVEPQKVTDWSSAYIEENDPIGRFVSERCNTGLGRKVPARLLYDEYVDWCRDVASIDPVSVTGFGLLIVKRFRRHKTMTGWVYVGVSIKSAMDQSEDD